MAIAINNGVKVYVIPENTPIKVRAKDLQWRDTKTTKPIVFATEAPNTTFYIDPANFQKMIVTHLETPVAMLDPMFNNGIMEVIEWAISDIDLDKTVSYFT